jgi:hypothetical protein
MATKKKDTGIARIDAKMSTGATVSFPMQESTRDILNKLQGRAKPSTSFDPNKATTKELEDNHFSGYRLNSFVNQIELWCYGKVLVKRNADLAAKNPGVLAEMHEEAFNTIGSIVQVELLTPQRKKEVPPFRKKDVH